MGVVREGNAIGKILEEYSYDENGNRIKKKEIKGSGNITTYYISDNFIQVKNASGSYNEIYYYDNNVLVGMKDASGNKRFYHPDHLGSTTLVTDINGNAIENTTYLPYGDIFSGGQGRYDYTGKEQDKSNLIYLGARYYDPNFTRIIQPDFIIQDVYNPQDLNHYVYVRNNPYKYVDPSGRTVELVTRPLQGPFGCCFTHSYFNVIPDNPGDFGERENFQLGAYSSTGGSRGSLMYKENYEKDTSKAITRVELQSSMSDTELINALIAEGESLNKANIPYALSPGLFGPTSGENSNVFARTAIESTEASLPEDVSYGELGGIRPSPGIKRTINYDKYSEKSEKQKSTSNRQATNQKPNIFQRFLGTFRSNREKSEQS